MFRRAVVRVGVESAGTATIVWVVPIEAGTIFPHVVFGFDLGSVSALLVVVVVAYRGAYTFAMVVVVVYLPSVLWATTIFTVEHVEPSWATFFV